ncbi:response regulator transcription factor [Mesorhizobium sp. M4B.F.Ca.ET.215.01.1.1]|uniref:LuxR C-terminal-related transcriptional regulator n=2 Tax=Mesorhizobium TaxID=68287 RepID=UPI000FD5E048|nr:MULTISPECIES: response regulator transcription factor [unclassified Mesorhizobium]RUW19632.1 response regulator transcription factor [Mesorhizobium sp. M4B.F.Ca.ET.013.02.1.1]RWF64451.1 MAG: response regulator transcription factor [Mesorhizobium sp.]TGQ11255.1 response regulator transcription factor [Mesorhizobium sp. M4B.F.Ca.ET.215.01.1.1]TGQ39023.1 response regulator transcription factor [Mesorhizobium sp. M4B.F.Ca.ET.214.01.1.1]TGQ44803.1 response regulator transcription factor [Mesorhi
MTTKPERGNGSIEERRVRVIVAERNPLVISALREMLECDGRFELLATVQSGKQFLEFAAEPDFDVALIGWKLADMDGADILAEVQNRGLDVRITVFSNDHDIGILKQCVRLGAQGYCFQFDDPPIIFETILAVAHGRICIPYIDINKVNDTPLSQLTVRERELLAVLSDGWTNLQIATRTGISENTVKYHLKNLYDKLDVRNRAMAVALYSSEKRRTPKSPIG